MASPSILRNASRPGINTCAICSLHAAKTVSRTSKRHIGLKWLAKKDEAEKQWQEQAREIRAGNKKSMLTVLEERGLVHQLTA
jgi:tyrosyl-tRNA synthetase